MTVLLYTLGIVLFLVGIGLSIALHELGHLVPAKAFGVKVTKYMVGFGPTVFSRRRGDTEYGIKLLPLGGFIAMPGMYPPEEATRTRIEDGAAEAGTEDAASGEASSTAEAPRTSGPARRRRRARLFERSMQDARDFSNEEIEPGEEHRTFYALSVPKRLVVMFGGPVVNLVLGIVVMGIVLLGIGNPALSTTVDTVVECAVPASVTAERQQAAREAGASEEEAAQAASECRDGDALTPAWEIGMQPGDTVRSIDGTPVGTWEELSEAVRASAGRTVPVVLERDGEELILQAPIIVTERVKTDTSGQVILDANGEQQLEPTGFLGIGPRQEYRPIPLSEFPAQMADMLGQTFHALFTLPQKLVGIGEVAFTDTERDPNGPIGMVGVGRIAGEVVSTDVVDLTGKLSLGLSLLGSLNLFLFAFNMVPLLPLDGGHIAVALYEGARRRINLWRGRGAIGPFDTARLLPLTYTVVGLMLCMTVLLVWVDMFEPIRVFE